MGNTDSIPVVSQTKSLVQVASGDENGALQTQKNFSRQCPVVAQARAAIESAHGDVEAKAETKRQFKENALRAVDGIPVVGHIKGTVHYVKGEKALGDTSMKAASRSTGVVAAGIGGFCIGGPIGAATAGVTAGVGMDALITGCDAAARKIEGASGELRPYGTLRLAQQVHHSHDPGTAFDAVFCVVADGAAGVGGGAAALGRMRPALAMIEPPLRVVAGSASAVATTTARPDPSLSGFSKRTQQRMSRLAAQMEPPPEGAPVSEYEEWQARLLWSLVRNDQRHLMAWLSDHPSGGYSDWLSDVGEDPADHRMFLPDQPQRALWATFAADRPQPCASSGGNDCADATLAEPALNNAADTTTTVEADGSGPILRLRVRAHSPSTEACEEAKIRRVDISAE